MKRSKKFINDYFDEPLTWETIETEDGALFVNISVIWELLDLCEYETRDHDKAFDLMADVLYHCERCK